VSNNGRFEKFRRLALEQIKGINSRIDTASLDPEKSLVQQGCDSLDLISLFTALSTATGRTFPAERLSQMLTISSIVGFLMEDNEPLPDETEAGGGVEHPL
jgi:acyl carrier protein